MAIKDNKSNIDVVTVDSLSFAAANVPQFSGSVDTANYDNGVTFFLVPFNAGVATTTVRLDSIQESDDNSTWDYIADNKYIGSPDDTVEEEITTFPTIIPSVGVFSAKRYLRARVVSEGNDGIIDVKVMSYLTGEEKPTGSE